MHQSMSSPLRQPLGNGLLLRTPADAADVARVAAFSGRIHGPGIAALTTSLIESFPGMELADLVFVEDERSGAVVSTLCLLPWRIHYGPAVLTVGEMGIVATDDAYRGKGLVRTQVGYFKQRLDTHGCVLSLIQGIPYFYRQFGYTYALPLGGGVRVEERMLPAGTGSPFALRRAGADDLPALQGLFEQAAQDLTIRADRDAAAWAYLLGSAQATELSCAFWLVDDAGGQPVGYVRLPDHHFGEELAVSEASRFTPEAGLAVLRQLTAWARERGLPGVRLELPEGSLLVQLARGCGAQELGRYAWQVHMPDLGRLLAAIVPALEQRLAASAWATWQGALLIDCFRSQATLLIAGGSIQVQPGAPAPDAQIQGRAAFPPDAFVPVLLGWRARAEVGRLFPDLSVDGPVQPLLDVLFPLTAGYLYAHT
jgi:predicted N-acetyltransferase YhbS